jgi:hypothetical protein
MKKKIIISSIICLAFISVLNINMSLENNKSTLKGLALIQLFEITLAQSEEADPAICNKNWQDCYDDKGNCSPDRLVCDGGGGC